MIKIAVIGCGYWGPNLIRNFVTCPDTELVYACDLNREHLEKVLMPYPRVKRTTDFCEILKDKTIDAVAIATPVFSHFPIAKACLESGKHVLIEKPLASSVSQGEELIRIASEKNLRLMSDHTFCYTGAVKKIKDIIAAGTLGKLLYFDSVRINLGLFQHDVNVIWDLAPHDLSILDFLFEQKPVQVNAQGVCHAGHHQENIAYVSLIYPNSFLAHLHVNWLSPVKIRKTIICGSEKMLVWDDLESTEKIKIYDKGIKMQQGEQEQRNRLLVHYRSGDIYIPKVEEYEALSLVVKEFAKSILENRSPMTDGKAGLRVLTVLEAAEKSIKTNGINIDIENSNTGRRSINGILSDCA